MSINHLAWGGHLRRSCTVVFKTTPVPLGIPFVITKYPPRKNVIKDSSPPVCVPGTIFKRLITGNLRVEAGMTRGAKSFNMTSF